MNAQEMYLIYKDNLACNFKRFAKVSLPNGELVSLPLPAWETYI